MKARLEIEIPQSPRTVFGYLTDLEQEPLWQYGVVEWRDVPGSVFLGAKLGKVRRVPKSRFRFTEEVTAFDPDNLEYGVRMADGIMRGTRQQWRVDGVCNGSRVTLDVKLRASGAWKILQPLVVRSVKRDLERGLRMLRRRLQRADPWHDEDGLQGAPVPRGGPKPALRGYSEAPIPPADEPGDELVKWVLRP